MSNVAFNLNMHLPTWLFYVLAIMILIDCILRSIQLGLEIYVRYMLRKHPDKLAQYLKKE